MEKLAIAKLGDGDFNGGFPNVAIEIHQWGKNGQHEIQKLHGKLPPCPELKGLYQNWQTQYRGLLRSAREGFKKAQVTQVSVSECEYCFQTLRASLNRWLDSEEFRSTKKLLAASLSQEQPPEIRFVIQTDAIASVSTKNILHRLPWHGPDLFPENWQVETAIGFRDGEASFQNSHSSPESGSMRDVKILGILGDSEGIDVEADKQAISKLPGASPEFLIEPKRADFVELWDARWDILFFAGHSETEGDGQTGLLYINPDDRLNIEEIRKTLMAAQEQGLKLAIFNSCDGLGLARQLADLNIPQIVVWREPVPDLVAQKFLKYFLTSFAGGKSLYRSVREARDKLRELEPEIEEQLPGVTALPVICQNLADEPVTWEKLRGCSGDSTSSDDPKPVNWLNQMLLSVGIKNILLGMTMTMVGITLSFTTNINISIKELYTGRQGTASLPPTTSHRSNSVLVEGYEFLQNGDYDRAEEKINQARMGEPKSPDPWYGKAQLALARENRPVALKYTDKALKLEPKHLPSLVLKIKLLLLNGGHDLVRAKEMATKSHGISEELDSWLNCLERENVFSYSLNTDYELDAKCNTLIYK